MAVKRVLITSETVDNQEKAVKESQEIFIETVSSIDDLSEKVKQIVGLKFCKLYERWCSSKSR